MTEYQYKQVKKQLKEELKLNTDLKRDLFLSDIEINHLKDCIRVYEDSIKND